MVYLYNYSQLGLCKYQKGVEKRQQLTLKVKINTSTIDHLLYLFDILIFQVRKAVIKQVPVLRVNIGTNYQLTNC